MIVTKMLLIKYLSAFNHPNCQNPDTSYPNRLLYCFQLRLPNFRDDSCNLENPQRVAPFRQIALTLVAI